MSWSPPSAWTETEGQLKVSGQVTLSSAGQGTVYLQPVSAHQRWEVTSVVVATNQPATATVVPVATVALNSNDITSMSAGNNLGASWSGNQDTFSGDIDVGPCDFLSVVFSPPPGSTGAQIALLAGIIAAATVTGSKYTRTG